MLVHHGPERAQPRVPAALLQLLPHPPGQAPAGTMHKWLVVGLVLGNGWPQIHEHSDMFRQKNADFS